MERKRKADDHLMADMYESPDYLKACLLQEQRKVDALLELKQSFLVQLAEKERDLSQIKLKESLYIQEISVLKKERDELLASNDTLIDDNTHIKEKVLILEEVRSQLSQQLSAASKDIEEEATAMDHMVHRFAILPASQAKDVFVQMSQLMNFHPSWIRVAVGIKDEFSGRLLRIEQAAMHEPLHSMNIGNLTITDIEHNHAPVVDNHEGGVLEIPIIN